MAFWSSQKVAIQNTKGKPRVSKPRVSTHHKQALSRLCDDVLHRCEWILCGAHQHSIGLMLIWSFISVTVVVTALPFLAVFH